MERKVEVVWIWPEHARRERGAAVPLWFWLAVGTGIVAGIVSSSVLIGGLL